MKITSTEFSSSWDNYAPKTSDEIFNIALLNLAGELVGSWQLDLYREDGTPRDAHQFPMIFMPLSFLDDVSLKELMIREGGFHVYGKLDDSLPRSINGMPMFHTVYILSQNDFERAMAAINRIVAMREEEY